jgi:hypothetical protein
MLTLHFRPDVWDRLGLAVSVLTLVGLILLAVQGRSSTPLYPSIQS